MFIITFIFYTLYKIQQNIFKKRTVIHIHTYNVYDNFVRFMFYVRWYID